MDRSGRHYLVQKSKTHRVLQDKKRRIFNNVKLWVCKIYIFFVFTVNWLCVYSFCCVGPLIVEHMISMAAISKTGIKHESKGRAVLVQAWIGPQGSGRLIESPRISRQSAHEGWQGCQPQQPAAFTPREFHGACFCQRLSRTQSHSAVKRSRHKIQAAFNSIKAEYYEHCGCCITFFLQKKVS